MKNIIDPIPLHLIQKELTKERFIRKTNNANNEIYIVNYHNSPNVTQEIGRLREITFRNAGGGTGKECDLDNFDTQKEAYYEQLIVWAPESKEIVGGYRFIKCINALNENTPLATNGLFTFLQKSHYYQRIIYLVKLQSYFWSSSQLGEQLWRYFSCVLSLRRDLVGFAG